MQKQYLGAFVSTQTGEVINDPFVNIKSYEHSYIKITRNTLARIIYDLSGKSLAVKMLAVLVNNMRESNNHINFGISRIIEYYSDYTEEGVIKAFNCLLNMDFIRAISKSELMFNPDYVSFGNSEKFNTLRDEYSMVIYETSKSKGEKIKEIGDIMSIPQLDNSIANKKRFAKNLLMDYHFAKIKDAFLCKLSDLPSKRIKILADVLSEVKEDDSVIIPSKLKTKADKETKHKVINYLCKNGILIYVIRGTYYCNANYISAKPPYKRKQQVERITQILEI